VEPQHDHLPKAPCPPSCPGWAEGALSLLAFQRRYPEMLEACRAAAAIHFVDVAPATAGVVLPEYLKEETVVRLNLEVGRDTSEVLLDETGIRCNLTFRGRRQDCVLPWSSVLGGLLRPPARKRPRFGVIAGTEAGAPAPPPAEPGSGSAPGEPAPAAESAPAEPPRPAGPRRFGVIEGGKGKKD
jgi:hypothetical protein